MKAGLGENVPNFEISEWVQGDAINFDKEHGNVVLVEIFQINCPGCFLYSLPEAVSIYNTCKTSKLSVIAIATAFEDFDKNTLENLKLLVSTGELIGETKKALAEYPELQVNNRLNYSIPFPVAMDELIPCSLQRTPDQILQTTKESVPDFDTHPESIKADILSRVKIYLEAKKYSAVTFERFSLKGTPSTITVDRDGILRDVSFGCEPGKIDALIKTLI